MAIRSPTSLVTDLREFDMAPREPIVTTHFDAALDNQDYMLRANRLYVSECFFPRAQSDDGAATMHEQWRTALYAKHKSGASFGATTIGTVYVLTYETDQTGGAASTQSYDIDITDGTNTDTTTISSFASGPTGSWKALTIANVVGAAYDMSALTNLRIDVGNFVGTGLAGEVYTCYLCGVYIAKDQ